MTARSSVSLAAFAIIASCSYAAAQSDDAADEGWKPGQDFAHCRSITVRDRHGHRIAGAVISGPAGIYVTDRRGRVCHEDLLDRGRLEVEAPPLLGGSCAGSTQLEMPAWEPSSGAPRVLVTLDIDPLPRFVLHGRVVSEDGSPVAGARISLSTLSWSVDAENSCSVFGPDSEVRSHRDGTFALPPMPLGDAQLRIWHSDFVEAHVIVSVAERAHIVLDRGAAWSGRVIGPDGDALTSCHVYLTDAHQNTVSSRCSTIGFELRRILPGKVTMRVRLDDPTLGYRALNFDAQIEAHEQRRQDVRWPSGESIAGRFVDAHGLPIVGANLSALPAGTSPFLDQFHQAEVVVRTDSDGRFTFRHLARGSWVLRSHLAKTAELTVTTGTTDARFMQP